MESVMVDVTEHRPRSDPFFFVVDVDVTTQTIHNHQAGLFFGGAILL